MSKEKIDLSTAVKDDQFMTGCGNIATYSCKYEHEIYTHVMMIGDYTHTYTTEGKHNANGESTLDLVSAVIKGLPKYYDEPETMTWNDAMDKYRKHPTYRLMTRDELLNKTDFKFNEGYLGYWTSDELPDLRAVVVYNETNIQSLYKGCSVRVRVVNKEIVDCQVNDTENLTCGQLDKSQDEEAAVKYDHKAMSEVFDVFKMEEIMTAIREVEDYVKVNRDTKERNTIIDDYLSKDLITPLDLINLGFEESYQPSMEESAGYIYYEFEKHGICILSAMSHEKPFYVFLENQREIHSLEKLTTFVSAIKSL